MHKFFVVLFVVAGPLIVAHAETVDKKLPILKNEWINVSVSPSEAGKIAQFNTISNHALWPQDGYQVPAGVMSGCNLILYASHPLESTQTIPLPQRFEAKTIEDASRTQMTVQSIDNEQLSVKREFAITGIESTLSATTTITNTKDTPISFYPSEVIFFNATIDKSRNLANSNCYFYSPYRPETGRRGYDVTLGLANNTQFFTLPDYQIFYAEYKSRIGEVVLTNTRNWIAVQNLISRNRIDGGTVCAIAYRFPTEKPKPVDNNVIVYTNGAGEYIHDGKLDRQGTEVDKYIRVTYILGQVVLGPGQSWSYSASWNASRCVGPIIEMRDGIVFNKRFEVYFTQNGDIENYVDLGVPQEGTVAVQHFDMEGKIFNTLRHPLNNHPALQRIRPSNAAPYYPTMLFHSSHILIPDDLRGPDDTFIKFLQDKISKIRLVLVDENKAVIRTLDEVEKPFKVIEIESVEQTNN